METPWEPAARTFPGAGSRWEPVGPARRPGKAPCAWAPFPHLQTGFREDEASDRGRAGWWPICTEQLPSLPRGGGFSCSRCARDGHRAALLAPAPTQL